MAAGLAVVASGAALVRNNNERVDATIYRPERAAVAEWLGGESAPELAPIVISVSSDVNTRQTPGVHNDNDPTRVPFMRQFDNHANVLEKGDESRIIVRDPIKKDGFYGFVDPRNKMDPEEFKKLTPEEQVEAFADQLTWVAERDADGTSLVTEYDDPSIDTVDAVQGAITDGGSVKVQASGADAAVAMILPAEAANFFESTLAPQQPR